MTEPTPERRRTQGRRASDTDTPVEAVLPVVEEALVRSSAIADLTDEVHELGEAVVGYRRALDRYREALERRLTMRSRLYAAAILVVLLLLAAAFVRSDRNAQAEDELRNATADAVMVECEKRKRLEVGLLAFLDEALDTARPERRARLLELAEELFSSIPCAELADTVRNAHDN